MDENYELRPAGPYPMGVMAVCPNVIRISAEFRNADDCGIILCAGKKSIRIRIPSDSCYRHGRICSCEIEFKSPVSGYDISYRFYEEEREFIDPYAAGFEGHIRWMKNIPLAERWAKVSPAVPKTAAEPHIPLTESVFYMLSVRSFTMHPSSGVVNKGTFEGIAEKADYIRSLGVNGVILMPAYEFNERMDDSSHYKGSMEYAVRHYKDIPEEHPAAKCNLWGYTGDALYYMPKSAFSASGNACASFAALVDVLHRDNIELIMQMYFEPDKTVREILRILEYWTLTYHVDGFQFIGSSIPVHEIEKDPLLFDRKLLFDKWQMDGNAPAGSMCAEMDDDFENDLRHFIKGDAYVIQNMISYVRAENHGIKNIHYVARQEGMRLYDLVTYNEKHNEANGENNCDGRQDDYSWNCGTEGTTRRVSVNRLRLRQMKNAVAMVLLTQGIPLIFSGDESGNTQYGNNNPYCQDNSTGWVKWNSSRTSRDMLEWTRSLSGFRSRYRVLHMEEPFRGTDYLSCAYPDISLHGVDAWRTQNIPGCHLIAVMYCMRYGCSADEGLIYAVYNMHWESQKISLPKPFGGQQWKLVMSSSENAEGVTVTEENEAVISERSIAVLISVPVNVPADEKSVNKINE